jgi:hypothetical protein
MQYIANYSFAPSTLLSAGPQGGDSSVFVVQRNLSVLFISRFALATEYPHDDTQEYNEQDYMVDRQLHCQSPSRFNSMCMVAPWRIERVGGDKFAETPALHATDFTDVGQ